jgi:Fe-S cluster biogenesis protein NfuA
MDPVEKKPVSAQIHPANPRVCLFSFGEPLLPGGSISCIKPDHAVGSPLFEALFALPGVAQVWVAEDRLTVEKNVDEAWPIFGKKIVEIVKRLLKEGVRPLVTAPVATKDGSVRGRVEQILEQNVNPSLGAHGGRVDVVDYKDGVLSLSMSGGCQGCSAAAATLKGSVEIAILSHVPEVTKIVDVTDHASGEHPYYS